MNKSYQCTFLNIPESGRAFSDVQEEKDKDLKCNKLSESMTLIIRDSLMGSRGMTVL